MKLVECVPNFSEGRNKDVIAAIADSIKSAGGVRLLDVDPGADTNRTVVTFIGSPEAVLEGAFLGIKKAAELIDMSRHHGEHARMGATDVCPFIPVSEVSMEECVEIAKKLGERVANELNIPVYLYENAAARPERRNLSEIRAGEYEALPEKFKNPDFMPDFGKPEFNSKSGATVIGAREFLIAYNINLNTTNVKSAKKIASIIREKGCLKKDENGKNVIDKDGNKVRVPGLFTECKATGWYIAEYRQAQVTMNLTNYKVTPPHIVFDEVCRLASDMGLRVTGSEIVGLVPKEAMIQAGRHYLAKQGMTAGVPECDLILAAIQSMGLSDITDFDPSVKIIESYIENRPEALANLTVSGFADELSRDSAAPGGGSVAALCGSLSAGLSSMVAGLTHGKKGYENYNSEMVEIGLKAQALKKKFVDAIDRDTDAFNDLMAAMKMKKGTPKEKEARNRAIQEATKHATLIPLEILESVPDAVSLSAVLSEKGNENALSDAGVAASTALACAQAAWYNVMINLKGVEDEKFKKEISEKALNLLNEAKSGAAGVEESVCKKLAQ